MEQNNGISSALKSYGGLASLAGINLPDSDVSNNPEKALEKLHSLSFFEENFLPYIFLPDLMAVEYWSPEENILAYDNDIYDISTNAWVRDFSYPKKKIPSPQESFKAFKENHLVISKDRETGFITLSIKHQSPEIAKKWSELLIFNINSHFREKDKIEAEAAINYLNAQLLETNFAEVKEVLAALLQQEIQKLTLIEVNESYVFEYIDRPVIMEEKSEPSRAFIVIAAAFFGAIFSMIVAIIRFYLK